MSVAQSLPTAMALTQRSSTEHVSLEQQLVALQEKQASLQQQAVSFSEADMLRTALPQPTSSEFINMRYACELDTPLDLPGLRLAGKQFRSSANEVGRFMHV